MSRSPYLPSPLGDGRGLRDGLGRIDPPGPGPDARDARAPVKLKEPVASRVYQRDANGRAEIPIALEDGHDAKLIDATVIGQNVGPGAVKFADGKLVGVPVGGPYTINCQRQERRGGCVTTSTSARSSSATSGCSPASRTWRASATWST